MARKRKPTFLTGDDANDRRQKMSRRQEKRTASKLSGRTTIGSGNKSMKGDVHADGDMVECKSTEGKQMTLKRDWLEKLVREAFEAGMDPVMVLTFEALEFGATDWAVIPLDRYRALREIEVSVRTGTVGVSGLDNDK